MPGPDLLLGKQGRLFGMQLASALSNLDLELSGRLVMVLQVLINIVSTLIYPVDMG